MEVANQRVLGIGVDVVETARIESSLERFGDRFLERVFTDEEIAYCNSMKYPARHYAARFAAKEAVSKAFGTGIGGTTGWKEIEVKRKESGEPYIQLHGAAQKHAEELQVVTVFASLSHSDNYSVANAVVTVRA